MMPRAWSVLTMAMATAVGAVLVAGTARAEEERLSLGEVSVPARAAPPGVDPTTLRVAAEREIRDIDAAKLPNTRRFVVSLAVAETSDRPSVAVSVNAMLRDRRTGTMLAILEGRARAEGGASPELRKAVLRAAVRSAVSQIPTALASGH